MNEYFARLEKNRPAINVGTFVGAGGVRAYVLGSGQKAAAPADLEEMKKLVDQAMKQGALGVSTSLQYVPGRFATTDEIVELAKVAKQYGGIYISHQRSESGQIMSSLDEVFAVAERASIPAEVWHLKTAYKANWGRMARGVEAFETARARGLDVTANMYPVRSRLERPRRVPAALGARRRPRADAQRASTIRRCAIASSATWTIRTRRTGRTSGTAPAAAPA